MAAHSSFKLAPPASERWAWRPFLLTIKEKKGITLHSRVQLWVIHKHESWRYKNNHFLSPLLIWKRDFRSCPHHPNNLQETKNNVMLKWHEIFIWISDRKQQRCVHACQERVSTHAGLMVSLCFSWINAPAIPPAPEFRYCEKTVAAWCLHASALKYSLMLLSESRSCQLTLYEHQQAKSTPQSCSFSSAFPAAWAQSKPTKQPCQTKRTDVSVSFFAALSMSTLLWLEHGKQRKAVCWLLLKWQYCRVKILQLLSSSLGFVFFFHFVLL